MLIIHLRFGLPFLPFSVKSCLVLSIHLHFSLPFLLFSVKSCLMLSIHLHFSLPFLLFSVKSCLMLSIHLHFYLPFLLFHGTSIAMTLLVTYPSSLLITCLYHFHLLSCTFLDISYFGCPSFLILNQFRDSTHPSQSRQFQHIQLLLLCLPRC